MRIYIEKEDEHRRLKFSGSVKELLLKLKLNPAMVLVVRNRKILDNDDKLSDSDSVRILETVMGG